MSHPFRPLFVEVERYMAIPTFGVCSMEFTFLLKTLYPPPSRRAKAPK